MSEIARLALLPRDGLFCKDGRGWQTSASGRGHALDWPWPSTVLGALRTAWGYSEEERSGQRFGPADWRMRTAEATLGPTLALRRPFGAGGDWSCGHRVWPVPADGVYLEGHAGVQRLDPVEPPLPTLGRTEDAAREGLWVALLEQAAKAEPGPRWWSEAMFVAWLVGDVARATGRTQAFRLSRRVQAHVGIRCDSSTADEGALFSHDVVETLDGDAEWAIGAEVALPGGRPPAFALLGSDRRPVHLEPLCEEMFQPPTVLLDAFRPGSSGLRLVVVTPTCFDGGWLPDGIEPCGPIFRGRLPAVDGPLVLRAAMVARPVPISGWDMARGAPKPIFRMVSPGAVYFFEREDGCPFGEADAHSLWLAAIGSRTSEGFGRVVPAVWNPTRRRT